MIRTGQVRAGAAAAFSLAQRMAAYDIVRSIAEADIRGSARPGYPAPVFIAAVEISAADFGIATGEVYSFIRGTIS